jgi:hypothetical protein
MARKCILALFGGLFYAALNKLESARISVRLIRLSLALGFVVFSWTALTSTSFALEASDAPMMSDCEAKVRDYIRLIDEMMMHTGHYVAWSLKQSKNTHVSVGITNSTRIILTLLSSDSERASSETTSLPGFRSRGDRKG